MSIFDIPPEMFYVIGSHLSLGALKSASLVCKTFLENFNDNFAEKSILRVDGFRPMEWQLYNFKNTQRIFRNLRLCLKKENKEADVTYFQPLDKSEVTRVLGFLDIIGCNLKSLRLVTADNDEHISSILAKCPKVTTLRLVLIPSSTIQCPLSSPPLLNKITNLHVKDVRFSNNFNVKCSFRNLVQLTFEVFKEKDMQILFTLCENNWNSLELVTVIYRGHYKESSESYTRETWQNNDILKIRNKI